MATKLNTNLYSPALFDIQQDIIGSLPLDLIKNWLQTEQNQEAADKLLEPYKVKGYSVSSDSAGLSKLSKTKTLLEVLAIINQPKEIVYTVGKHIGGQGIGIWAADNTQMFYPSEVKAETLVSALLTVQQEISKTCQIKIGLGAHYGEFYLINGGLYGASADAIEEIAENDTEGGEVLITESIYNLLPPDHTFKIVKKGEETDEIVGRSYTVLEGPVLAKAPVLDKYYPMPYSEDFYADLITFENDLSNPELGKTLESKYLKNKAVVLLERENQEIEEHKLSMFSNMSFSALVKDVGLQTLTKHTGDEIKVIGNLGIYVFDTPTMAVSFSRAVQKELAQRDVLTRIGIDMGSVFIFDLPLGGKDIAGMPVNLASKMAQDKGRFGYIYLNGHLKQAVDVQSMTEISYTVSGVEMTIYEDFND